MEVGRRTRSFETKHYCGHVTKRGRKESTSEVTHLQSVACLPAIMRQLYLCQENSYLTVLDEVLLSIVDVVTTR